MKKVLFAVLAAGMVAAGCEKENIFDQEDQTSVAPEADPVYDAVGYMVFFANFAEKMEI